MEAQRYPQLKYGVFPNFYVETAKLTLASPEDVVIAVMGITGAGKSTFINHLVDQDVKIGHELVSCETE